MTKIVSVTQYIIFLIIRLLYILLQVQCACRERRSHAFLNGCDMWLILSRCIQTYCLSLELCSILLGQRCKYKILFSYLIDFPFPAISSTWLHRYHLNWTELDDNITEFNDELTLTENWVFTIVPLHCYLIPRLLWITSVYFRNQWLWRLWGTTEELLFGSVHKGR